MRTRSFVVVVAMTVVVGGAWGSQAAACGGSNQAQAKAGASQAETTGEQVAAAGHHGMDHGAEPESMAEGCATRMAKRQAMREQMAAMDVELGGLVEKMDSAAGDEEIAAMAAVLDQLVAQHRLMHESMAATESKTMQHGTCCMQMGMAKGGSEAKGGCPMMHGAPGAEGGHEGHR